MIRGLIVLCLLARVAAADDAEQLYNQGQQAYEAKRYDDAIAAWSKSYELSKLPALLFNLAQAHRLANHCTKAVDAYKKFVALDPQADDRPAAEQFMRELSPCHDAPQVTPHDPVVRTVDQGHSKRRMGVVAIAGGAAILATGIYFGSRATSLASDVKDACAMGCEFADVADKDAAGHRDEKLQYVFLGVGAIAIGTGAVLYVLGAKARETRVTVGVTGRGVALAWRF